MAQELPLAKFIERFNHPFLVVGDLQTIPEILRESHFAEGHPRARPPDTLEPLNKETSELIAEAVQSSRGIYPVTKSPHNLLRDRVSVGRMRNSDIVFSTRYVSKVHAHFLKVHIGDRRKDQVIWELCDAGSTNGTFHKGVKLRAGERARLDFGDTLRFGYVEAQFVSPKYVHDGLRRG